MQKLRCRWGKEGSYSFSVLQEIFLPIAICFLLWNRFGLRCCAIRGRLSFRGVAIGKRQNSERQCHGPLFCGAAIWLRLASRFPYIDQEGSLRLCEPRHRHTKHTRYLIMSPEPSPLTLPPASIEQVRQAQSRFHQAVVIIDSKFGTDYSKKNPALVIALLELLATASAR